MKKIICFLLLVPLCIDGLAQSMVPKAPKLNLDSYILIEASTNTVIAEFNSDDQISPASMTKVMSGYVVADQIASGAISLDDKVLISEKAWKTGGSKMFIEAGKRIYKTIYLISACIHTCCGNKHGAICTCRVTRQHFRGFVFGMMLCAWTLGKIHNVHHK